MARSWPVYSNRPLDVGLTVLREPAPPDLPAITRVLVRYADTSQNQRRAVAGGIPVLLAGPTVTRTTVARLQQQEIKVAEVQVDVRPTTRGLHAVRKDPAERLTPDPTANWDEFAAEIDTAPVTGPTLVALQRAAAASRVSGGLTATQGRDAIHEALGTPASPRALEAALIHVLPATPNLFTALRDHVLPELYRTASLPGSGA